MHNSLIWIGANVLEKLNNLCERVGLEHAGGYRRPHPPRLGGRGGRGWRNENKARPARGPIGKKLGKHNIYYGKGLAKPLICLAFMLRLAWHCCALAWWRRGMVAFWQGLA